MGGSNRAPSTRATGAFGALLAVLALTCTNCLTLSLNGAQHPAFVNLFQRPCPRVDYVPLSEEKSVPTARWQAMQPPRHVVAKQVAERHGPQHWLAVMGASLAMLLTVTLSPDAANAEGYQFRQNQVIPIPQGPLDETLMNKDLSGYQRAKLRSARRTIAAEKATSSTNGGGGGFGDLLTTVAVGVGAVGIPAVGGAFYIQQALEEQELEEEKRRIELQQSQNATKTADFTPVLGGAAALVLGVSVMSADMGFQAVTPVSEQDKPIQVLPAAAPPAAAPPMATTAGVPPGATGAPLAATAPAVLPKPAAQPEATKAESPKPEVKQEAPPKAESPKPEVKQEAPKAEAPKPEVKPATPPQAEVAAAAVTEVPATKIEVQKESKPTIAKQETTPVRLPAKTAGGQQNKAGLGIGAMTLIGAGVLLVSSAEEEEAAAIA